MSHSSQARGAGREGFALVMALGAIVVIGALVAGAFFVSTRDLRSGRAALSQEQAQLAAEYAMNEAREAMTTNKPINLQIGQTRIYTYNVTAGSADTAWVTKLSDVNYLLNATGRAGADVGGGAGKPRRRTGLALALIPAQMLFPGALTARGSTTIGGSSLIDGNDHNPLGWNECPPPGAPRPGVVIGAASQLDYNGCSSGTCVQGNPPVSPNPIANDTATYFQYGPANWETLKQSAYWITPNTYSQIEPSYRADGSCNPIATNWGDPVRGGAQTSCEQFFRIYYVPGDLKITGNFGQGVLLVEGDLEVQGGFEFYGPVIVKGHLKTTGTGGHFNGGVMAANVDLEQNTVLGDALISYSSCALQTALKGAAPFVPVRHRAWTDLY